MKDRKHDVVALGTLRGMPEKEVIENDLSGD